MRPLASLAAAVAFAPTPLSEFKCWTGQDLSRYTGQLTAAALPPGEDELTRIESFELRTSAWLSASDGSRSSTSAARFA